MWNWKTNRVLPIGVDLGPGSVRMAQLAAGPNGNSLLALAEADVPLDPQASTDDQDLALATRLRQMVRDHGFKGRKVVTGLGAEQLFVQNVRLPQLPDEEVSKVVNWEAEERLPYPVAEAEVRHLLAGQVRQDNNVKQEVILLACHRGVIERRLRILEAAGLEPQAIDVEPCAILRALDSSDQPDVTRQAYLNLGEDATSVMFGENDQVLFLKYITTVGRQLDQAIARQLGVGQEEAARLRAVVSAADELSPDDEVHRSVIDAIRPPLESVAAEIELCLRYYTVTFRGRPLDRVLVTGCDAAPWLVEFFQSRLGNHCEIGDPARRLVRDRHPADRCWKWTTSIGLSLKSMVC